MVAHGRCGSLSCPNPKTPSGSPNPEPPPPHSIHAQEVPACRRFFPWSRSEARGDRPGSSAKMAAQGPLTVRPESCGLAMPRLVAPDGQPVTGQPPGVRMTRPSPGSNSRYSAEMRAGALVADEESRKHGGSPRSSACRSPTMWPSARRCPDRDLARQGIADVPFFPIGGFHPRRASGTIPVPMDRARRGAVRRSRQRPSTAASLSGPIACLPPGKALSLDHRLRFDARPTAKSKV